LENDVYFYLSYFFLGGPWLSVLPSRTYNLYQIPIFLGMDEKCIIFFGFYASIIGIPDFFGIVRELIFLLVVVFCWVYINCNSFSH